MERPTTIISGHGGKHAQLVFKKSPGGNDNYYSEVYESSGKGWVPAFRLGPRKSTLANLPEDETPFPASTWLKRLLMDGVRQYVLNSRLMRNPSPPHLRRELRPDGSNLPWVVADLSGAHRSGIGRGSNTCAPPSPDLANVTTVEREEDRHRYSSWNTTAGCASLVAGF